MKKFFLHPWEGDEEHLSLRQIAKLEGLDQQTVLVRQGTPVIVPVTWLHLGERLCRTEN